MNRVTIGTVAAAAMLLLVVGEVVAGEANGVSNPREMIVGSFSCVTFPDSGPRAYMVVGVNATSGLLLATGDSGGVGITTEIETGGVDACEAFARDAQAKLETTMCLSGAITRVNPNAANNLASRSIRFVCSGGRDKMVETMAALMGLVVTRGR